MIQDGLSSIREMSTHRSAYSMLIILAFLVTFAAACKSESGLFVTGDTTPVFEIRRSSYDEVRVFPALSVVKLHPDNEQLPPLREDESKNELLWKIVADPTASDKTSVQSIERIEYGRVPNGFIQQIPQAGDPPNLSENQTYEAIGPLSLMRNAVVRFKLAKSKIVVVATPE